MKDRRIVRWAAGAPAAAASTRVSKARFLGIIGVGAFVMAALPGAVLSAEEPQLLQGVTTYIRYTDPATGEVTPVPADCSVIVRVEAEDGSADEWQACTLGEEGPAGPVAPPTVPVTESDGECLWSSDYWATVDGSQVPAATYELTVTPGGRVYVWSTYPAEGLSCQEG